MKTIIACVILFCVIAYPTFAPPQSSVETDIAVIKTEIKNLKESMDTGIKTLKESMNTGFANVQQNFDRQNNIIIAGISIPWLFLAIVGTIWGILANRRGRKEDTLQNQIETMAQDIETLKKQRGVQS